MFLFSIKGLLRDRSRSLFPILMVSASAFLCVCLHSTMKGTVTDMVDSAARFDTGHVKIMTRAYNELADQMPNDLALMGGRETSWKTETEASGHDLDAANQVRRIARHPR